MPLKPPPEDPSSNHDRWLISYADFITLMFAFFVVLYASSQADKDRARQLSEAVENALASGSVSLKAKATKQRDPKSSLPISPRQLTPLDSPLAELRNLLKPEIASGTLDVHLEGRGLVISLKQAAFFPSGDATVATAGYAAIEKVAGILRRIPNAIRLEGHTDSLPIRTGKFISNWHLSSARSIAMLELLSSRFQIPEARLAAVGYGDTVPLDSNDTEQGRARNRRVDITILTENALDREPKSSTSGGA